MPIQQYNSPGLKMSSLKSTDQGTSKLHEAAAEGDLETLKRLVQDLDDKNPSSGKKLLLKIIIGYYTIGLKNEFSSHC